MVKGLKTGRRSRKSTGKSKKVSKSVKRYVNKQIHKNIENKQSDYQVDSVTLGSDLSIAGYDLLDNITQGSSQNLVTGDGEVNQQMAGLQIRCQYLEITATLLNHIANGSSIVRLMVVLDKQASNNTNLGLYSNATAFDNLILQTDQIASPVNGVGKKRFKILYDKFHYVSNPNKEWKRVKIKIPLDNMLIQYYPTTTSFFALNKKIRFYAVATNGGLDDSTNPSLQFFSRIVYEDA